MRMGVGVALLLALILGGCIQADDLNPFAMACTSEAVQQAGFCDGALPGFGGAFGAKGPSDGSSAGLGRPTARLNKDSAVWEADLTRSFDHVSFSWDGPAAVTVAWSAQGTGGMSLAVFDSASTRVFQGAHGTGGGEQRLGGRPGAWTVTLDFDNFEGHARALLHR